MDDVGSTSRLEYIHASVFSLGVLSVLFGLSLAAPLLLVLSGLCFVGTGMLIWAGARITLAGPLGGALRLALGRTRVLTLHLRAAGWLLLGLFLLVLGIDGVHRAPPHDPPMREPPIAESMSTWTRATDSRDS